MTATGCKPPGIRREVAALLPYRPDGRLERVSLAKEDLAPACVQAVTTAIRLIAIDAAYPHQPNAVDVVFPFVNRDLLACAAASRGDAPAYLGTDEEEAVQLTPPVKKKEVRPDYPPGALKAHIEGAVLTHAVVTTRGCVSEVEVLSGLHPDVDQESLNSVSQWVFAPALLRGTTPQAVHVRVEVSFAIRR